MDMKKYWFSSGPQSARLGRSYTKPRDHRSYDGTKPVWETLWRKLRRDKKKGFSSCAATTREGIYDPETYSKNFDPGMGSMEPDNLCRSFSARFADPSRILPPKHLLDS
ncbi:hypothetical protein G2W53_031118 [Senna tora]|uniref:Uncharacterized protein n=1 Tax=Senna tora TaxID=362788 RepID=A0A834T7R4_9FABA|nr:hypothetical protein G2W53_031118 [Senna tora]